MRTSKQRPSHFSVTRHGVPIETHGIRHKVLTGISFGNELYPLWDSVIEAGATLEELYLVDKGGHYSGKFLAKVMAFNRIKGEISLHSNDAQVSASEKAMKKAKRKR